MFINDLKQQGYCIMPGLVKETDTLLEKVKRLCETEETSANVPFLNRNQPNVYNLQNKGKEFIDLMLRPEIVAVLQHFLNDTWYKQIPQDKPNFIIRAFGARSSLAALPLHIDSFIPYTGGFPLSMQVAIILEDQSEENGCTVVVPGSHQSGQYARQGAAAISLTPKAGDVVIWDSRLWHGTTENKTTGTRWSIIATFSRWWVKQQFNFTENLPREIYQQLTNEQKSILGYCSIPFDTEKQGIDIKQGYEKFEDDK